MTVERRKFIADAALLAAGTTAFSLFSPSLSWGHVPLPRGSAPTPRSEPQISIPLEDLLQPGPLEEMSEGDENAPVIIVQYTSLTCAHCARFHNNVYPLLKKNFFDTGKVRLIMREFPGDRVALAASMMTRCADKSQYFPLVKILFKTQAVWARAQDPVTELFKISKLAGFTEEKFNTCLTNKEIAGGLRDTMNRGRSTFTVSSPPTFFIDGQKVSGGLSFEDFEKLVLQHLNG